MLSLGASGCFGRELGRGRKGLGERKGGEMGVEEGSSNGVRQTTTRADRSTHFALNSMNVHFDSFLPLAGLLAERSVPSSFARLSFRKKTGARGVRTREGRVRCASPLKISNSAPILPCPQPHPVWDGPKRAPSYIPMERKRAEKNVRAGSHVGLAPSSRPPGSRSSSENIREKQEGEGVVSVF